MKVSIIMPAYNAERYITEAINSVLNQTEADWELIVIDDCSTDNTKTIVQNYAALDSRIHLIEHKENQGASVSRMDGISASNSLWIAFLDSDDYWQPNKLQKQFLFVHSHPDAQILYTGSAFISENGDPYKFVMRVPELVTFKMLLRGNVMPCSSVLVRKAWVLRYPMQNDSLHEDYATWLQILRDIPHAYGIDEPLIVYRLTNSSKSSSRIKSGIMVYKTYRYIGYDIVRSIIMTLRYAYYSIRKRKKIYA